MNRTSQLTHPLVRLQARYDAVRLCLDVDLGTLVSGGSYICVHPTGLR